MASIATIFVALLVVAAPAAHAATQYVVGGSAGWSLGVDYNAWAFGKTFKVGDSLVFNFASTDGVAEVTLAGYTSCSTVNALKTYAGTGSATITLTAAGINYFISTTQANCLFNEKLAITVVA